MKPMAPTLNPQHPARGETHQWAVTPGSPWPWCVLGIRMVSLVELSVLRGYVPIFVGEFDELAGWFCSFPGHNIVLQMTRWVSVTQSSCVGNKLLFLTAVFHFKIPKFSIFYKLLFLKPLPFFFFSYFLVYFSCSQKSKMMIDDVIFKM